MVGPPTSPTNLSSASDTEISAADAGQSCCCDSCSERRFVSFRSFNLVNVYVFYVSVVSNSTGDCLERLVSLSLTHSHSLLRLTS